MAPVYSTLFVNEPVPPLTPTTGALAPPGQTIVLRDLEIFTPAANIGAEFQLYWPVTGAVIFDYNYLTAGHNWTQWSGRIVLPPGFQVNCYSIGFSWHVTLSGYLLSA